MKDKKPFSTVSYVPVSELGLAEVQLLIKHNKNMFKCASNDADWVAEVANGNTTHFVIEHNRVNKFLHDLPTSILIK